MKILKQKIDEMVKFDSLAGGELFYFENNPLVEVAHVHVEDDKDD